VWCNWCDYEGWTMITLEKLVEVEKIVVRWRDAEGAGTDFGREYKVLVSTVSEPPDPNLDDGYWVEIAAVTEGNGGMDLFDLAATRPLVKHVALWLQQDAYPWTKEFIGKESFAVAEIEVWDAPKKAELPPPAAGICE